MKPYKLNDEVMNRVNSIEEYAEEILFLAYPKLWEVNYDERVVTPNSSNNNCVTLNDYGIGSSLFDVETLEPTVYINVPVDENQLNNIKKLDEDF